MFDRILYPTDCSDVATKAVSYIEQLKEAGAKEVTILHVLDKKYLYETAHEVFVDFAAIENSQRKIVTEECNEIVARLRGKGLDVKVRIEKGIPFQEILRVANEENASLIVIGSHGKSNVQEMLIGSVSEAVIRHAVQPVLVIKR